MTGPLSHVHTLKVIVFNTEKIVLEVHFTDCHRVHFVVLHDLWACLFTCDYLKKENTKIDR